MPLPIVNPTDAAVLARLMAIYTNPRRSRTQRMRAAIAALPLVHRLADDDDDERQKEKGG